MSVAENGENLPGRKSIGHRIRNVAHHVSSNPTILLPALVVLGLGIIDQSFVQPARLAESKAAVSVQATVTAITIDTVTKDYNKTGGIDLIRQKDSYLVVLRGSASLAGTEATLLDNAWSRIRRESECQPAETVVIPEVPGDTFLSPPKSPKSYLIRINCGS